MLDTSIKSDVLDGTHPNVLTASVNRAATTGIVLIDASSRGGSFM